MVVSGRYRWWNADCTLRLYPDDPKSKLTISVPSGYNITKIVAEGGGNLTANTGQLSGATWTGFSNSVVLSYNSDSGSSNMKSVTVTYTDQTSKTVTVSAYEYATASFSANVVVPDGATVSTVTGVEGGVVTLSPITSGKVLKANVGVIIYKEGGGDVEFSYTNTEAEVTFSILYTSGKIQPDDYILGTYAGGFGFCHPTVEIDCAEGKAFLDSSKVPTSAPFLRIGGTTNVGKVMAETEDGIYYDLMGRKVEQPQRGIYIMNGKKVLVK
jgi:hypothetical protein